MRAKILSLCAGILFFLPAFLPEGRLQAVPFIRGDVDGSGTLDLTDPVLLLGHLFLGDPEDLRCKAAADGDDSGGLEISDSIYTLAYLFLGGSAPPAPFPTCGEDPTQDGLGCGEYASCNLPADEEPPAILGSSCTEIACDSILQQQPGDVLDLLKIDRCNTCTPLRMKDNAGIARIEIEILGPDPAEGTVAFSIQLPLDPPARLLDLTQTDVVVLLDPGPGLEPEPAYRVPILQEDLRIPRSIALGPYFRRISAVDGAGNRASADTPVAIYLLEGFQSVQGDKERDGSPAVEAGDLEALVAGNTAFLLDLYRQVRGKKGNIFFSPYSISLALAMTYAGARGGTEQQMASTLHFDIPQERLHPAFNALDLELSSRGQNLGQEKGDGFRLRIANSIWGQVDYSFLPAFLDVLSGNYGAGLRLLDFLQSPDPSRIVINDWIAEETENRIKDLLPPGSITPLTRLVLTNAIYFKASWLSPFLTELTRDATFHTLDDGDVVAPQMLVDADFGYARGEGFQAVELPYLGQEISMVVLLPAPGRFESFEGSLDGSKLAAILGSLRETRLVLRLPKFRIEFDLPLKDTLVRMGMPDAFVDSLADFSGINGLRDLFIHDVLHKAFVSVDENGTEAAAATAVIIGTTSVPPEVVVDGPFIFLVRDIQTGAILFIGRVTNPAG